MVKEKLPPRLSPPPFSPPSPSHPHTGEEEEDGGGGVDWESVDVTGGGCDVGGDSGDHGDQEVVKGEDSVAMDTAAV